MLGKKRQKEVTGKKIAVAAKQLFVLQGYSATSIENIAAAAGCSKGNIYYHYQSKAGLFSYLLDEWNDEWMAEWRNNEQEYASVREKLFGMAEHLVRHDMNHPLIRAADEFFGENGANHQVVERLAVVVEEHIAFNEQLVKDGIEGKEFREQDARQTGTIIESLWIGLSEISRYRKLNVSAALELYRTAVSLMLQGMQVDEGHRPPSIKQTERERELKLEAEE